MPTGGFTKWRDRIWLVAPLFLWIGVIFYLSSGQGSFEQTSRFIGPLLAFLFPDVPPETLAGYHGFIRKSAHFFAYAILGLLAFRAYRWFRGWPALALSIVLAVAVLDELNQSFNDQRTGSPADVLLDFTGGLCAVASAWMLAKRRASRKSQPVAAS